MDAHMAHAGTIDQSEYTYGKDRGQLPVVTVIFKCPLVRPNMDVLLLCDSQIVLKTHWAIQPGISVWSVVLAVPLSHQKHTSG